MFNYDFYKEAGGGGKEKAVQTALQQVARSVAHAPDAALVQNPAFMAEFLRATGGKIKNVGSNVAGHIGRYPTAYGVGTIGTLGAGAMIANQFNTGQSDAGLAAASAGENSSEGQTPTSEPEAFDLMGAIQNYYNQGLDYVKQHPWQVGIPTAALSALGLGALAYNFGKKKKRTSND